jgi:hypothetical protein
MAQTEKVSLSYYLEHKHSTKYVASDKKGDGAIPFLWGPIPAGHEKRYQFRLVLAGDYFYLMHEYSGKYLGAGTKDGDRLVLGGPIPKGHEDRYLFKSVNADGRRYSYLQHKASGKFVGAGGGENDNGAELLLWGPIPKGHEDRYRFCLFRVNSDPALARLLVGTWANGKLKKTYDPGGFFNDGVFLGKSGTWIVKGDQLVERYTEGLLSLEKTETYTYVVTKDELTLRHPNGANVTWKRVP